MVTELPEIVAGPPLTMLKLTGNPEVAVALTLKVPSP
jgi:hypothetical protein